MATPDVTFIAGLDDSQVQSKLAGASKSIGKLAGGPISKFLAAGNLLQVAGLGGLAGGGGLSIAVGAITQLFAWQQRVTEEARREREEREKTRDAAIATFTGNLSSANIEAYGGQLSLKLLEVRQRMQGLRDEAEKARYFAADAAKDINERLDILGEYNSTLASINRMEKDFISQLEKEVDATNRAVVARTRVESLMAQGAKAEADTLAETERHAAELAKIQKMAVDTPTLGREYRAEEMARHRSRLDQIQREELDRQDADDRAAQRLADAAQSEQERANILELQLQQKLALAAGDEAIAKQLEKQIDHEQRLRQIRDLSTISQDQRTRLLQAENELYAAQDVREKRKGEGGTRTAGAGFVNFGQLSALSLGGSAAERLQREQVKETRRTNTKMDELINSVRSMAGGATYA